VRQRRRRRRTILLAVVSVLAAVNFSFHWHSALHAQIDSEIRELAQAVATDGTPTTDAGRATKAFLESVIYPLREAEAEYIASGFEARVFEGGANSIVSRTVGHAEGTRTASGERTSAFYGHTDPGNGVWNLGSFSYQHGARSPEEADEKQLARLQRQADQILRQAKSLGLTLSPAEFLNGVDLANQAPLAALGQQNYVDWLKTAETEGLNENDAILWARTQAFINPATGRWDAPGLGNTRESITRDQARRMAAIARALDSTGIDIKVEALPTGEVNQALVEISNLNKIGVFATFKSVDKDFDRGIFDKAVRQAICGEEDECRPGDVIDVEQSWVAFSERLNQAIVSPADPPKPTVPEPVNIKPVDFKPVFPILGSTYAGCMGWTKGDRCVETSDYGWRTSPYSGFHRGIDYGGLPIGTVYVATEAGWIEYTGWDSSGGGHILVLRPYRNPDDEIYYMHLRDPNPYVPGIRGCKGTGEKRDCVLVEAGQPIGYLGTSGGSTGPHLHFGLKHKGQFINPRAYLEASQ
jgi:murein DD-endopeptidase MepM/ murein hydrolase activator NlpD